MKFMPLKDFLLIQETLPDEVSKSGIVIPESADQEPPMQGKIVEAGKSCEYVKKDDTVMFRRYGFDEITIDDTKYLVGKEDGVFGKLDI